jgi:hypothetical protein
MRKTIVLVVAASAAAALALVLGLTRGSERAGAADHLDAPLVKLDGRIDINDVYAFQSPQDPNRAVLVMTTHPAAGVISSTDYRPGAKYEFLIDRNGDARPDATIQAMFSDVREGVQRYTVRASGLGRSGVIATGVTGAVTTNGVVTTFAGLRDDPFFFDLANFNNGATFCGSGLPVSDFFLGLNTNAIVLEVPRTWMGSGTLGIWGRTVVSGQQVDRMGRPAILTVFIPPNPFEMGSTDLGNLEDQFNRTQPADDQAKWRGEIVNTLLALGNSQATADALADFLLPDVLTVDLSSSAGFPNGRRLADDVIDVELGLITGGAITTDCVANDSTFLSTFPYLGVPN